MKRFLNIVLLFSIAILLVKTSGIQAANVPSAEQQEHGHNLKNIQIIKDIKAYMQQNPHLRLTRLHKKTPQNHRSQSVKYTLGNRVKGDHMLDQYADTFYSSSPRDFSVQQTYPETGTGDSIVTFVDINCLQDNVDGNAYVVAGGIGQRFISIVLEATQTTRFTYNIHVYGTD